MYHALLVLILLASAQVLPAQSGRTNLPLGDGPGISNGTDQPRSAEELFNEVSEFAIKKYQELEKSKTPYDARLHEQILQDQKLLAAKYAAELTARPEISLEDSYFLGLLQNLATNLDGAAVSFKRFLTMENAAVDKAQRARFLLAAITIMKGDLAAAESLLAEYLKNPPIKPNDRTEIESMFARSYTASKDYDRAIPHAEEAYRAVKAYFAIPETRPTEMYKVYQVAAMLFTAQKEAGKNKEAIDTMKDLQSLAATHDSYDIYFSATDKIVMLMIENGQKADAIGFAKLAKANVDTLFHDPSALAEAKRQLKKRDRQYEILFEKAPALTPDQWLSNDASAVFPPDLRGKVVMLDFWATWCGPCVGAFPTLSRWQEEFRPQGFEIVGVTHFYGGSYGLPPTEAAETEYVRNFVKSQRLPYDIAIFRDISPHIYYGVESIPTAVLIDRKGVIRYITSGANSTRDDETEKMIRKLLAEK